MAELRAYLRAIYVSSVKGFQSQFLIFDQTFLLKKMSTVVRNEVD
jgi:hypothetical protein